MELFGHTKDVIRANYFYLMERLRPSKISDAHDIPIIINNYNRLIYPQLIAEVTRRGFTYYDWNVSGEDASTHATWTSIYNNVLNGIENNSSHRAVVLLHDSADKQLTVKTVEDIIIALQNDGYTFGQLDNTVKPVTFSYVD